MANRMNPGTPSRRVGILVIPVFLVVLLLISPASAQEPFTVEWKEARLSVSAKAAPIVSLLGEVARLTGLEIRGLAGLQATVDVRFSRLPLREGLKRLLAPVNSVIFEEPCCDGGTRPSLVFVFNRQGPLPVEAPSEERLTAETGVAVSVVINGEKEELQEGPAAEVVIYDQKEEKTRGGS